MEGVAAGLAAAPSNGCLTVHLTIADTDNLLRDIASIRFRGILVNWLLLMISPLSGHHSSLEQNQVTR